MTTKKRGSILHHLTVVVCLGLALFSLKPLAQTVSSQTNGPVLLTQPNSNRAIVVDAITLESQPFSVKSNSLMYGSDRRSRITLFARNLNLQPGEAPSAVTVDAEDESQRHYVFVAEHVGKVLGEESISQIVVRLSDDLSEDAGDVLVRISYRGVSSNSVRIGVGRVGNGPFSALEFDGSPQTVDYGTFWDPDSTDLGKFFWEAWAMPGIEANATYMVSDGYGGAHALLFGFSFINSLRYSLFGNVYDGARVVFFTSDDGPAVGEWGHFAVGWDRRYIVTYYNGVPVGRVPFAGPRRTPGPNGGGSRLLIGGSDHNNLIGRIAQVRGYEGVNQLEERYGATGTTTAFVPETFFGVTNASGGPASSFLTRFVLPAHSKIVWTNALGVQISGSNLTKTAATGWNAGASSAQMIRSGDGYAEFTANETFTERVFGLSGRTDHALAGMDYAINLKPNRSVVIYQSGVSQGSLETYTTGDRFRISLSSGTVKFIKNGKVFYTSNIPAHYPLRIDSALFDRGSTISDSALVGAIEPLAEVPDLAGGRVGRVRGVGFGILDPTQTFPLPQFVVDQNYSLILADYGETLPPVYIEAPRPTPTGARVFDSFSRKSATFALGGVGGLGVAEGGSERGLPWQSGNPSDVNSLATFGILNGSAVILSRGPAVAWLRTNPTANNVAFSVDRRVGRFGSGFDTGLAFRVRDSRNFFFAFTSGDEDKPASERSLTVGYWLDGTETLLLVNQPMPSEWTSLRVVTSTDGGFSIYADEALVHKATKNILATEQNGGLYNHRSGMALTNRWDNFTVRDAP